jgi:uncharacterized membrane protein
VNNWKVIFATVIIFGAGVITGGLLVNYVQHPDQKAQRGKSTAASRSQAGSESARATENAKLRPPEILSKQFLQQLDASLSLRLEQREAIQKIINEGQNQIRKVIQDARLEIREVLTAQQRRQFDELVKRPFRKPIYGTNAPPNLPPSTNAPAI